MKNVTTKADCLANPSNKWENSQFNFDHLGIALLTLFVFSTKDGWVDIMYSGIDAVGVDKQPIENHNEYMVSYFISFLILVGFFILNMFVGIVVDNFQQCHEEQENRDKALKAAKRARKYLEKQLRN